MPGESDGPRGVRSIQEGNTTAWNNRLHGRRRCRWSVATTSSARLRQTRDDYDDTIPGPITRLNPDDEWPVLIERQLRYVAQTLD